MCRFLNITTAVQYSYLQSNVKRTGEISVPTIPQGRQRIQTAMLLLLRQISCFSCDVIPKDEQREPVSSRAHDHTARQNSNNKMIHC